MGVAQRIDRDAGAEIEISGAILGEDIGSFAPDERDVRPIIGWQQRREHGLSPRGGGVGCDKPQSGLYRSLRPIGSSKGPARPVFPGAGGVSSGAVWVATALPLCLLGEPLVFQHERQKLGPVFRPLHPFENRPYLRRPRPVTLCCFFGFHQTPPSNSHFRNARRSVQFLTIRRIDNESLLGCQKPAWFRVVVDKHLAVRPYHL